MLQASPPRPLSRWFVRAAAGVLTITLAAAVYGQVTWRSHRGRPVVIDFSESIDSRVVYPMGDDQQVVDHPARVALRFPGDRIHVDESAESVWIDRGSPHDPNQIYSVSTTSENLDADQAYAQARQLRDYWRLRTSDDLEAWHRTHQTTRQQQSYQDDAGLGCEIGGTDHDGRRLHISVEIKASYFRGGAFILHTTFLWAPPSAQDDVELADRERQRTGTTVRRVPQPVC